jgi:hypothetical protein
MREVLGLRQGLHGAQEAAYRAERERREAERAAQEARAIVREEARRAAQDAEARARAEAATQRHRRPGRQQGQNWQPGQPAAR